MSDNKKYLVDKEINLSENTDLLGTRLYVEQLKEMIITCMGTDITETIGLIGGWGSGKSSIIKTLQEEMEKNKSYPKTIRFINYNAWKFNKDNFRKQFLINSYEDEKEKSKMEEELYTIKTKTTVELNEKIKKNIKMIIGIIIILVILIVGIIMGSLYFRVQTIENIETMVGVVIKYITLVCSIGIVSFIGNNILKNIAVETQTSEIKDFSPNDFSEYFHNAIRKNKKYSIFIIDDIDRCDPSQTIEILDTIKGYLKETKGNYQFIIPIDKSRLFNILEKEKGYDYNESEEYFSKIFDLSIFIKQPELNDMFDMIKKFANEINLNLSNKSISLLSDFLITTPRNVKTHLNNIKSMFITYQKQIKFGLIEKNIDTNYLDQLIKIYIIEKKWNCVYNELKDNYQRKDVNIILHNKTDEIKELEYFLDQSIHTPVTLFNVYLYLKTEEIKFDSELVSALLSGKVGRNTVKESPEKFVYHFEYVFDKYILKRNLGYDYLPNLILSYFYFLNISDDYQKMENCKIALSNIYSKFDNFITKVSSSSANRIIDERISIFRNEMIKFSCSNKCDSKYRDVFEKFIEILFKISDLGNVIVILENMCHIFSNTFIINNLIEILDKDTDQKISFNNILKSKVLSLDKIQKLLKLSINKNRKDTIKSIIEIYPETIKKNEMELLNSLDIYNKLGSGYSYWSKDNADFDLIELSILNILIKVISDESIIHIDNQENYAAYVENLIRWMNSTLKGLENYTEILLAVVDFNYLMEKRCNDNNRIPRLVNSLEEGEDEKVIRYIINLEMNIKQKNEIFILILNKTQYLNYVDDYCDFLNHSSDISLIECWEKLISNGSDICYNFTNLDDVSSIYLTYEAFMNSCYLKMVSLKKDLSYKILEQSNFEQIFRNDNSLDFLKKLKSRDERTSLVINKVNDFNQYLKCIELFNKKSHSCEYKKAMTRIIDNIENVDKLLEIHNYLNDNTILNKNDATLIKQKVNECYPNEKDKFDKIVWSVKG